MEMLKKIKNQGRLKTSIDLEVYKLYFSNIPPRGILK